MSKKLCPYCGCLHDPKLCPNVKRIEYNPDGSIKKVELFVESKRVKK